MDQEQKILNKAITIQEVQMKQTIGGSKYAIKDHEGRTFNFFTTKKNGNDTSVFSQFKNMGLKIGDTVQIGYVEDEFEREGKKVISKKIINFRETNEAPSQTSAPAQSGRGEANRGQYSESRDAFGKRLAIHGMVNGILAGGIPPKEVSSFLPDLLKLEDAIDQALSAPLEGANLEPELPVIQQEDDLSADDIPW